MMPQIRAAEQLDAISAVSIGGGHMKQESREERIRKLEQAARGDLPAKPKPASTRDLASMGIGVRPTALQEPKDG